MNQLRCTPEVQSLGDGEKRANLTKFHMFDTYLLILSQTEEQTIELINGRSVEFTVQQTTKERTKEHEIHFLAEANLTPRHLARFSHASRQRVSGEPLS